MEERNNNGRETTSTQGTGIGGQPGAIEPAAPPRTVAEVPGHPELRYPVRNKAAFPHPIEHYMLYAVLAIAANPDPSV